MSHSAKLRILLCLLITILICPTNSQRNDNKRSFCPVKNKPAKPQESCRWTYYVSPEGNDRNTGKTPQQAWQTLQRVTATRFRPGSCIYLRGGSTFKGQLRFSAQDGGDRNQPVVVGAYGRGRARILSGDKDGVVVFNTAGFVIQDLEVVGSGYDENFASGIVFFSTRRSQKLLGVLIQRVDVHGYGDIGISIGSKPADRSKSGFKHISILDTCSHDNGRAGIKTYGPYDERSREYAHAKLEVRRTHAYRNHGQTKWGAHSGSGIVIGDVLNGVVSDCKAYDNGSLNRSPNSGPIGIWTYESKHVTIEHCEAFNNYSGNNEYDGGGFDLDSGSQHCVLQHNYSHDNDGAGFMVFQGPDGRRNTNNMVMNNLSINDGRIGVYGGICIGTKKTPVLNVMVYANTVYARQNRAGKAAAVRVWAGSLNAEFYNNFISVSDGIPVVSLEKDTTTEFWGNQYESKDAPVLVKVGGSNFGDVYATSYYSIEAWSRATGAES